MKNYRRAFAVVLGANILLAAGLGYLWWSTHHGNPGPAQKPAAEGRESSGQTAGASTGAPSSAPPETPLAPVQLTPQRLQSIGVETGRVQIKNVADEIRTVGDVEIDETKLAYVQVRFPGWIKKVFAGATYQYIHAGQPLFTIYSPDLVTTEREYLLAQQNRDELQHSSIPGVAADAGSLLDAASERLKQWEVPDREIVHLEATGTVRNELEIDSPVSGYITERNALPNMYVQPETKLYTVANLSTVWVYAAVFQSDSSRIAVGQAAIVTTDAYPGRTFSGHVDYLWPQIDTNTRTQRVRLVFSNAQLKLKPGMFVNVRLQIPMGRHLAIPASGVLQAGLRQIAFVDHGGGYLEPREIQLGPRVGNDFIVEKGLKAGEKIVTSANFLVDSESQLQAALGSYAPPPPGAGPTGGGPGQPAAEANVEFASAPSPPHKGDNTFRVKLTDKSGAAIAGAQVTVTFYMPAMPAMGMAAMRTVCNLTGKGGGQYEASGKLQSGGTWQVTIAAQKKGRMLAVKQLSVSASGAM
ncbi:MAG TPA: FixH family protein [Bryobacteraceae bacterium]|jgi:Cu(I)/Ag(I) efflux system membrane fusion protein/cobalt-zinc-cadmium efflux system membrane fusion protein|nr:FixH family protein [Bryobacteraceae bacterium]